MQMRDLQRQYHSLQASLDAAMQRVCASGRFVMGQEVAALEQRLANYVGSQHCIACANGTDALRMALMAWHIGSGDAVFVPDFTFFATAEAVALQGATPVFVDVEPDSFNLSADDLRRKIAQTRAAGRLRPRAVIAVDLFGRCARYDAIRAVTEEAGLWLLEDGAQGFGASRKGKKACSFGDMSTTSFFPAKPLGCYGDGGAIFTDNDAWAAELRSIQQHGRGEEKYHNIRLGLNSRLDALQAAVLQVKLDAFESHELGDTAQIALLYNQRLQATGLQCPTLDEDEISSWAQYTLVTRDSSERALLQQRLQAADIPTAIYYPVPLHRQPALRPFATDVDCPVADDLCQRVLSLPMHPYLTRQEVEQVAQSVAEALQTRK